MCRLYNSIRSSWLSLSLKRKFHVYTWVLILIAAVTVLFNVQVVDYTIGGFGLILDDNAHCGELQEAFGQEFKAFEKYVRERSDENQKAYRLACERSESCILQLPFDYQRIGQERYARSWNIRNGYEQYRTFREELFSMDMESDAYITELYDIYSMQEYLRDYASTLTQMTMEAGNADYQQKVPVFQRIPIMIAAFAACLLFFMVLFSGIMARTIIRPVQMLANCSRKIAQNDFSDPDLQVPNRDEMGELVFAFNKMKLATEGYINTLKKNSEMAELLHKEELERIDMEKQLNAAQLALLKSQIDPHFLFNTLNVIVMMIDEENPESSAAQMIVELAEILNYSLSDEEMVTVAQEMDYIKRYIGIMRIRYKNRFRIEYEIPEALMDVKIPKLILQPLIENAIFHGVNEKTATDAGLIRVSAKTQPDSAEKSEVAMIQLTVEDNGKGMSREKIAEIQERITQEKVSMRHIGVQNTAKRIALLYAKRGKMEIFSEEGKGTRIVVEFPVTPEA